MALRMRELGYEIRREGKNWDIAMVPKTLAAKFSRRMFGDNFSTVLISMTG